MSVLIHAQEVVITVFDADLAIPLEGAAVYYNGQQYACDSDGQVTVAVPDNQSAVIQVTYPGYESVRQVIPPDNDAVTVQLTLGGMLENAELVLEVARPDGGNETHTGRSVSIAGEALRRTAEIGIVEDIMTSIKLLPGVGYSGMFNAQPSIRGGEPGDLMAVMDGFYIENPYHWGGSMSIFDPRMVESAKLSHGVFSARYGHTTAGLLEVTSRKPSSLATELEVGISSSATNLRMSFPLNGKGGITVMGKLTYWDPFVWLVQLLAPALRSVVEEIDYVNAVSVAPYIRNTAFSGNYRFTDDLELTANGYFGGDGVGTDYQNPNSRMKFTWDNMIGFVTTGAAYTPRPTMIVRGRAGVGFHNQAAIGNVQNWVSQQYQKGFVDEYPNLEDGTKSEYNWGELLGIKAGEDYRYANQTDFSLKNSTFNTQFRGDFDWDIGKGFLFASGAQLLYNRWSSTVDQITWPSVYRPVFSEVIPGYPYIAVASVPTQWKTYTHNEALFSSLYSVMEWNNPDLKLGAELGLRVDHLLYTGDGFSINTVPVLNPRLNVDYNLFKNRGIVDSVDLTAGTGLFSSLSHNDMSFIDKDSGLHDFDLKPARTFTNIIGAKVDFLAQYTFNIEAYYKYGFDRSYTTRQYTWTSDERTDTTGIINYFFDGQAHMFGFDFMLQKKASRFIDGWISYSFNVARYRDPLSIDSEGYYQDWYYPSFHRFHNLNVVLNYKPTNKFSIAARLSYASGALRNYSSGGTIASFPVFAENPDKTGNYDYDSEKQMYVKNKDGNGRYSLVQRYYQLDREFEQARDGFTIPVDLKFSWFNFNKAGKTQSEMYLAIENVFAFLKTRRTNNTTFNNYTGVEEPGSDVASYSLPIPMISFGFKWSY
ncbi:MAG: TonB-dependent receptor plug domain-containing protein [Treponema sp.]|nr:TonB-dependent receptor plug domain-containing protein [Treponema sp.]